MTDLREFKSAVLGRAALYVVMHHLNWRDARSRAAKEIAAEWRAKAPREKHSMVTATSPASLSDDTGLVGELASAKAQLMAQFQGFFSRRDARLRAERAAKRAARKAQKSAAPVSAAHAQTSAHVEPTAADGPAIDNVIYPLVYSGAEHTAAPVEDPSFVLPARYRSLPTENYRESIRRNEALAQQRNKP